MLVLVSVEVMVAISAVEVVPIRLGGRLSVSHHERLRQDPSCIRVQQIYPGRVITVRCVELHEVAEESCQLDESFGGHGCECECEGGEGGKDA